MRFVLTVSGWYLGGIVTFCSNLSAGLRREGHEVVLLRGSSGPLPSLNAIQGLFDRSVIVRRGVSRISVHIGRYVHEIDHLKPDVLVINDSPYVMAALPFIARAIVRTPVIHSTLPNEIHLGLTNPQWWDRVITVSESTANAVAAQRRDARVSVCSLGVHIPSADRRGKQNRGKSPIHVISVGRVVVRDKRMDRLPVIAKMLTERKVDYHWTVLGDGDYLPRLRRELSLLGLLSRFSLKGSVPQSVVASTLEAADVFVMPSDSEGTPQALLEAMAHGVVPVASRIVGSATCIVEDRICGYLCEPSCPAEFANAIDELASNLSLRREMGRNAAETIAKQFSLEAFTERFLAIIEEVRSCGIVRAHPLAPSEVKSREMQFGCLGFWRCLRTETLGRLKRRFCGKRFLKAARAGGLAPSV